MDEERVVEIAPARDAAVVLFKNLTLDDDRPKSSPITVTIEKYPMELEKGKVYCAWSVVIDEEIRLLKTISDKAETLATIPEVERIKAVLTLLREHIRYAYQETVSDLQRSNLPLAEWVAKNVSPGSTELHIPLSLLFENGYGICRHLAVAYLWLAQRAGLKGLIHACNPGVIKNIKRTDTGTNLFKSVGIGERTAAHAWVEMNTECGWIPVDPSVILVGDTEERFQMFRLANYLANASLGLYLDVELTSEVWPSPQDFHFEPGSPIAQGNYYLQLIRRQDRPSKYEGDAKMIVKTANPLGQFNARIINIK